jgi:hypothetical protein
MNDDVVVAELAAYQEALVEHLLLDLDLPADERHRRLVADPRAQPFLGYVQSMDLRLLEVTSLLMHDWARGQR